jgi:hypothetical protein
LTLHRRAGGERLINLSVNNGQKLREKRKDFPFEGENREFGNPDRQG